MGSDFEMQTNDSPPASPWNAGPNSVVTVSETSQSPFTNHFSAGELGIHMPNRGEYDGFGLTLPRIWSSADTRRAACLPALISVARIPVSGATARGDIMSGVAPEILPRWNCSSMAGNSFAAAAMRGNRSAALNPGEWYQVQLTLDLKSRVFTGDDRIQLITNCEFNGEFASGWNGRIDYSFIDSYGHIGGVRPCSGC